MRTFAIAGSPIWPACQASRLLQSAPSIPAQKQTVIRALLRGMRSPGLAFVQGRSFVHAAGSIALQVKGYVGESGIFEYGQ